jgi:hypothetical protein
MITTYAVHLDRADLSNRYLENCSVCCVCVSVCVCVFVCSCLCVRGVFLLWLCAHGVFLNCVRASVNTLDIRYGRRGPIIT